MRDFDYCPHCHGQVEEERTGPHLAGAWCVDCGSYYADASDGHDKELATGWVFGEKMCAQASMYELTERDVSLVDNVRALAELAAKRAEAKQRYVDEALF